MSDHVVVIGAGYAGAGAVKSFEEHVEPDEAQLTWISEHDYHLVLHEVHRAIRKPGVESEIAIPVDEIKSDSTNFIRDRVVGIDTDERTIDLEDEDVPVEYDYLLVAVGSGTAFFGIEGLEDYSLTLKSLDDARAINESIRSAAADATQSDPAEVIIGGAGLSGIQTAGEIAEYRDDNRAPINIKLVEGLDEIFPGQDPEVQGALKKRLLERDIEILTGDFISAVDEDAIHIGDTELDYDVLVWTGGITGHDELADAAVDKDERSNRIFAESDFRTSDDRVFAIGDSALIDQGTDEVAPPTAQAAWQAADVAGENLVRAVRGAPLKSWKHTDKGTVISVGDDAVAHDVAFVPINTFGGPAAKLLKKTIATRWIADISSAKRAVGAFGDM